MNSLKLFSRTLTWATTLLMVLTFAIPSADAYENLGTFKYQWKAQSGTVEGNAHVVRANPGDVVPMSLTIINRSTAAKSLIMYGKTGLFNEGPSYPNAHAVGLGTSHPRDIVLPWLDSSKFVINSNRFAYYDGAPVAPGQDLTLNWEVKIATNATVGTYDVYTEIVREWDEWTQQVTANGFAIPNGDIFWRFIIGDTQKLWEQDAYEYRSKLGEIVTYTLPPAIGIPTYRVWGTDIYSDDSSVGMAAVHAGRINFAQGGAVRIRILSGRSNYIGSLHNGVESLNYDSWDGSFEFVDPPKF